VDVCSSLPSAMKKLNFVKCLNANQPKITLRGALVGEIV